MIPHLPRLALCALITGAAPLPSGAQPAGAPAPLTAEADAAAWLAAAEARAAELGVLQSRMIYTTWQDLVADEQVRYGDLLYRPPSDDAPSAFRIHLDRRKTDIDAEDLEVIDRELVYDGRYLLDIDNLARTATRRDLTGQDADTEAGADVAVPIPLEVGGDLLDDRYTGTVLDDEDPALVRLSLTPRPGADADPLDLWLDRRSQLPVRGRTTTPDDDWTEIRLKGYQRAEDVDEETFSTELPTGTGWELQDVPFGE